jgi:hypothetical protein
MALAGVYQAGNEAEDLHFYGGRYGILTEKASPAWQFTLIDTQLWGRSRPTPPRVLERNRWLEGL